MPALAPQPAPTSSEIPTAMKFNAAFLVTALLLINHFGRPFEKVLVGYKLPAVVCGIGILAVLINGGIRHLRTTIGFASCALVAWMTLAVPFSTWRGGSANYVLWYVAFWVVLMLMISHAPRSAKEIARIGYITGIAAILYLATGSEMHEGRLAAEGTFGNSDDVALLAGFAMPFLILLAMQFQSALVRYPILLVSCGYILYMIGMTATRAAVLALAGMVAVYFLRGSMLQRAGIAAATAVATAGLIVVLPDSVVTRLATIFDSFDMRQVEAEAMSSEAMASTAMRRDLLLDALRMTRDNPVFGVGPGEYPDYRYNRLRDSRGRPKRFFPSHNTYAQVAAESGIPGLLFYLFFLWAIYRSTRRVRLLLKETSHPDAKLLGQITTCLEAAFVYFVICAIFMTCDRHPHQFVLAGMVIAMERLLKHWASSSQTTTASLVSTPSKPLLRYA